MWPKTCFFVLIPTNYRFVHTLNYGLFSLAACFETIWVEKPGCGFPWARGNIQSHPGPHTTLKHFPCGNNLLLLVDIECYVVKTIIQKYFTQSLTSSLITKWGWFFMQVSDLWVIFIWLWNTDNFYKVWKLVRVKKVQNLK